VIRSNLPRSRKKDEFVHVEGKQAAAAPTHPLANVRLYGATAMGFAGLTPLPHTLRTKLKYAEHLVLTGTTGALGLWVFNASSLYDPNYTGTGHQPRGFDQLMPLYDHFVVLKSKIRVSVTPTSNTASMMAGVSLSATVTNQGDWDDYAEGPVCRPAAAGYCLTSGFIQPTMFELHYSAKDFLGIPDPITADKLQGTISANPVDNAFYHIFCQDAAESATVQASVLVEIEYDVAFIEPINPAQS
jgi:hypothetical protein